MDFGDKSSGFGDLKNTVDRGSAESFGPVPGFCQSRSSDCGSDHQFSDGLGQCAGVLYFIRSILPTKWAQMEGFQ